MTKRFLTIIMILFITRLLFATPEFCGKTVLVVLEPEISHLYNSVDDSFWGNLDKVSVENIFQLTNPKAINALQERQSRNELTFHSIYKITLPIDDVNNVLTAIDYLKSIKGVKYAGPNYFVVLDDKIPNDPLWNNNGLWNLHGEHGIKVPAAWNITTGSRNVVVGIIDTGVGSANSPHPITGIPSHSDLHENLLPGWCFETDTSDSSDDFDHGTKSAGIVGAVGNNGIGVVGVNWNVSLVPLKAPTSRDQIVDAIRYATDKWDDYDQIDILTMSMFGQQLGNELNFEYAIGNFPGLFVRAAGNNNANLDVRTHIQTAASVPNVIIVGAIDILGRRMEL